MTDNAIFAKFELSLLGQCELTGPHGRVDLPGKKIVCLLGYLACTAPQPQSRERLRALLWGSRFDTQSMQNLRQSLFRLRKVLGDDALKSEGEMISLNAGVLLCDVDRFKALLREGGREALNSAVDLYKGQLIDNVNVSEEGWNEWLAGERERLHELALDAMVQLGELELTAGDPGRALVVSRRAIALSDLREDAHRLKIQALAATGRNAEAIKHYQRLVVLLKHELNSEPDAATSSLVAELRNAEPPSSSRPAKNAKLALPKSHQPSAAMASFVNGDLQQEVSAEPPEAQGDALSLAASTHSASPERRQLTILVCNMVDATTLAARLDPEDMRDLVSAFHKVVCDVSTRFGGYVAQYLGDGALVYFGYPAADEDDAEQAVRAGLAICEAVRELKITSDVAVHACAGIATGLVVVGAQPGPGGGRQPVAIGATSSLAAQLQPVAAPGEVVIAASTRRLVKRMFNCRALAPIEVKGLPQPLEAWQVCGETGATRFDARRADALYPLVDRQEEMDFLLRRWDQARLGVGRVVLISGEPGIGKSRIIETLLGRLEGEPHTRLRYFCSPHHVQTALHLFIDQLERAASFEPGSDATAKLDRLETLLKPVSANLRRDVVLAAELLGTPLDERYPAITVSPQQKREMTLSAALALLDGAVERAPVVIVIEDAHWLDPTSQDLLDRMVAHAARLPVLLVVTVRPEMLPNWVGEPHVSMLTLSRLGGGDSAGVIAGVTGGKPLPDVVLEQVLARTDGVPLFIEELTSTLLESGVLRETPDRYELDGPLPSLAIPATLQASLVARLDRLGPVKEVAQIGAAIGREFSHELIAVVSPLAPADLVAALEKLTAAGLISRRGTQPTTYSFKHALVQDAAYATMLKSKTRHLHASIAKVLVEQFPAEAERAPEVVALHFTEADMPREAIVYWRRAGRRAYARWANREAVKSFEQALAALRLLPEMRETIELGIAIRLEFWSALQPLSERARMGELLQEVELLAKTLGDQHRLAMVATLLGNQSLAAGAYDDALRFGQQALTISQALGDRMIEINAMLSVAQTHSSRGEFRDAVAILQQVVAFNVDPKEYSAAPFISPAIARAYLADVFSQLGRFDEGIGHSEAAVKIAEAADHHITLYFALLDLGRFHLRRGNLSIATQVLERCLDLCRKQQIVVGTPFAAATLGAAYALANRAEEALPLVAGAVEDFHNRPRHVRPALILLCAGFASFSAGRIDEAASHARDALALARKLGARSSEVHALCLAGDIATTCDAENAFGHYRNALTLAERLEMRPLIAHCHLGLGKLFRRTATGEQAMEHFVLATEMYRDMGMTIWQAQVKAELRVP